MESNKYCGCVVLPKLYNYKRPFLVYQLPWICFGIILGYFVSLITFTAKNHFISNRHNNHNNDDEGHSSLYSNLKLSISNMLSNYIVTGCMMLLILFPIMVILQRQQQQQNPKYNLFFWNYPITNDDGEEEEEEQYQRLEQLEQQQQQQQQRQNQHQNPKLIFNIRRSRLIIKWIFNVVTANPFGIAIAFYQLYDIDHMPIMNNPFICSIMIVLYHYVILISIDWISTQIIYVKYGLDIDTSLRSIFDDDDKYNLQSRDVLQLLCLSSYF